MSKIKDILKEFNDGLDGVIEANCIADGNIRKFCENFIKRLYKDNLPNPEDIDEHKKDFDR